MLLLPALLAATPPDFARQCDDALRSPPAVLSRTLPGLLETLAAAPLPPVERLNRYAALQDACTLAAEWLQGELRLRELSTAPRAREAAWLARRLAQGRLAVLIRAADEALRAHDSMRAAHVVLAAQGAMQDVALAHLTGYHPLPDDFWENAHAMHRLAGELDVDADALAYKALRLIGMIDTQRLSPAQQHKLASLAVQVSPLLGLLPGTPPLLDTAALADWLRERSLSLAREGTADAHDDAELYQTLLTDLRSRPMRREVREKGRGSVELVAGLAACWHLANGGRWHFPETGHDEEELEHRARLLQRPAPASPVNLTVVDQSGSGLALAGSAPGHALRAGEFVLWRARGQNWQGALVRWVRYGDDMDTRVGLEIVARRVEPLMMVEPKSGRSQLALSLEHPLHPPQVLLAGRVFNRLAPCQLVGHGVRVRAYPLRVARQTPLYQLIEHRAGA